MSARVISITSGKGGVGKTTLACNLGSLWAARGKRVLLIDGDWSLGKLSIALGVKPTWTVESVLRGQVPLENAIQSIAKNLFLLASPSGLVGFEELDAASRNQIFFELQTLGDRYDIIIFDHSSGINWSVLQFAAASHHHLVVTTPEPTSYTDAYAIMKVLARRFGIRNFSLLMTMSEERAATEAIVHRFLEVVHTNLQVRVKLLDVISRDPRMSESIRRQTPYVQLYPNTDLTRQLEAVCLKLEKLEKVSGSGLCYFYGSEAADLRA